MRRRQGLDLCPNTGFGVTGLARRQADVDQELLASRQNRPVRGTLHFMGQFQLLALADQDAGRHTDRLARMGLLKVVHRGLDGEIAHAGCNVIRIRAHMQHHRIGSIGKDLTIAALVHVTVVISPIGRDHPTQRVVVTMTIAGRAVENVPFEVVETNDGRWLVQNVNLEVVMR